MLVMASREQQVLALIRDDPMAPQQVLADRLGITRSAVAGHIMSLTRKGIIKGRGYVLSDSPFVTVVGGANVDIHGKSREPMRANDSNPGEVRIAAGGVARNVAENLARFGIDTRLISAVGGDHYGELLLRLTREAGVDVRDVRQFPAASTSTYLSVLDDGGDMLLAVNDMAIIDRLTVDALQASATMLKQAAMLVVDTNLQKDTLAWSIATASGTPVFADTVSAAKAHRLQEHLKHVHTLKTGTIEAEALTGLPANTLGQLKKVATDLHAQGVRRVFVTRGEKGVFFSDGSSQGSHPIRRDRPGIRNAGGAGDAFLAGLVYSWLQAWDLPQTLRFASATADITLTHAGTNHPELSVQRVTDIMELQDA